MTCCQRYGNCNQGRTCPLRVAMKAPIKQDADLPIVMFDGPDVWLKDMVLTVVYLTGVMAIGVGVVVLAVYLASLL